MKARTIFFKFAVLSSLIVALVAVVPHCAFSLEGFPGKLDLFTQKTPFGGTGPNNQSDAFQPQELVILYALVTFNQAPVVNKIVSFEANGPTNSLQNITVNGAAVTNESGIAEFSFRMLMPSINAEQTVFGEWYVTATVDLDQVAVNDSLTFEVGWIIRIKNIATLNDKLSPQTDFFRQSAIVFNLTLENIALTPRTGTITIDAQDIAGYPIVHIELDDLNIQPGESYTQASSQIPQNATLGEANVSATAYNAPPKIGGTPYSPSVYTTFNIIKLGAHDVAIRGVSLSTSQAYVGEIVEITVEAANLGDFSETFNVTVYYDSNPIQVIPIVSQPPHSSRTITVEWNTMNVAPGVYTISANATIVEGDANPNNNNFTDGRIAIVSVVHVHDVAIRGVSLSTSQAYVGEIVEITVEAANLGDFSETFNVTVYYDSNPIQVIPIVSQPPHSSRTITVEWNTMNVAPGVYTISANATIVEGDANPNNNNFTDGRIAIVSAPVQTSFTPYLMPFIMFLFGLGILAGLAFLILLLAYYSRRRRRRRVRRTPRYAIIVHPHI